MRLGLLSRAVCRLSSVSVGVLASALPARVGRAARATGSAGWEGHSLSHARAVRAIVMTGLLAGLLTTALALAPARASAEPLCTNTWEGPSGGAWQTESDWSAKHQPTSSEIACISSGNTVVVSSGSDEAGIVQGEGTVRITGGSLNLTSLTEHSVIRAVELTGGALTGPGTLEIKHTFEWDEAGTMSGAGETILASGASGGMEGASCATLTLTERTLLNRGTLTLSGGAVSMSEGARLENEGTFRADSEARCAGPEGSSFFEASSSKARPLMVNDGVFEKIAPAGGTGTTVILVPFENREVVTAQGAELAFRAGGSSTATAEWSASAGGLIAFSEGSVPAAFSFDGGAWSGAIEFMGGSITAEAVNASAAQVALTLGTLSVATGTTTVESLSLTGGVLTGAGTLKVSKSFSSNPSPGDSNMSGSGKTIVGPAASGTIQGGECNALELHERALINEGTLTFTEAMLRMYEGARLENKGTFKANSESKCLGYAILEESGGAPDIINTGTFEKTEGIGTTRVEVRFENLGLINELSGKFEFVKLVSPEPSTLWGGENPSAPGEIQATCGTKPVSCATGNEATTQADFAVGGRGVGLDLARTYNSQAAAEGIKGPFGYGWSSSFSDHLVVNKASHKTTLYQANGSSVPFTEEAGESFKSPAWTQDVLSGSEGVGYTLLLADQTTYRFNGTNGRLESVTDRNGNATTFSYGASGLEAITDPAGRKITLKYSGGLVESATDPMGNVVRYTYEGGNLATVTQPGESSVRWQFAYNAEHELETLTDGRGHTTTIKYNGSHQVVLEKDPLSRELSFSYEPLHTVITNKATGAITDEQFASTGEPVAITRGFETESATTESFSYNPEGLPLSITDGNGHITKYTYDGEANRTSMVDPDEDETKWTYDTTHDVLTTTSPKGETTTVKRDEHGNATEISRPAPESTTQKTKYTYDSHGDLESVEDPLKRTWKYEYDAYGDRESETDPEKDKRTWKYNEDSQQTSNVAPRGNVEGGEPSRYTTTIERDAQGRPLKLTEPPGEFAYSTSIPFYENPEINFAEANAVAVDSSGNIFIADAGHDRIVEFNSERKYVRQFGEEGSGPAAFKGIGGIATNKAGDIYATDPGDARVQEFEPDGTHLRSFGGPGSGTNEGKLSYPTGIAVDSSGNVWLVNAYGSPEGGRITEFSETEHGEKTLGSKFGSTGTTEGKIGISSFGLAISGGNLYVTEYGNSRVQEFSTSGEYRNTFDPAGSGTGKSNKPYGIATDSSGNLYVAELGNSRVQEFSAAGAFITAFGSAGSGSSDFSSPRGIAVAPSGPILVADTGNSRVQVWEPAKGSEPPAYAASITYYENPEINFAEANAVAVDSSGNIFIADAGHDRIVEFNSERKYVRQFGEEGSGPAAFKGIGGIATNKAGDIYATDPGDARVQEFEPDGTHLRSFGGPGSGTNEGKLSYPTGIAVDSSGNVWLVNAYGSPEGGRITEFSETEHGEKTLGSKFGSTGTTEGKIGISSFGLAISGGNLYVTEYGNSRVQEFSTSGEYRNTFDPAGSGTGKSNKPYGIATDSSGNLYVAELGNSRVQEFSAAGAFITAFGSAGSGSSDFSSPRGIAVAPSGPILVADTGNSRVQVWAAPTRITKYAYDGDGNLATMTDPNGHTTTYTYDADNEPTKVKEANGTVTETAYDGTGQVESQTDGNKHTTTYKRNVLGEISEVIDPLSRTTIKKYDGAGNLTKLTDAKGRETTYTYDPANRLTKVSYSDGKTPTVEYEYDKDGDRTKMIDGTGQTTYRYDELDRLIESEDGHEEKVKYKYDSANEQTKIVYPNGKEVTREYDSDGRLKDVTDWLGNTTKFAYDPDSDLTTTTFPSGTGNKDEYAYSNADQMSGVRMANGSETLASLGYGRDGDGQVIGTVSEKLPGDPASGYVYDEDNRLVNAGSVAYKYDAANNPTTTPGSTNTYNEADELEKASGVSYAYDKVGERTNTTPSSGPATSYGYDEAGNLISVERPKEGATPEIKDSYGYDGNGLRASQTTSGGTSYLTWDSTEDLPLLLSDGSNSYLYGPSNLPVEQISNGTGAVLYLHHDQQGSTRLLTGESGKAEATFTYSSYGEPTGHTGTVASPLGYDGQYTNSDTGMVYLRAREYDPATAQFLSSDPIASMTRAPYSYTYDNPVTGVDPTGLCSLNPFSSSGCVAEGGQLVAGGASEAGDVLANAVPAGVNRVGKFVAEAAPIAGPVVDVVAGVACAASEGLGCVPILAINTLVQEALVSDQAAYQRNFTLRDALLDQAGIVTGDALGGLGALAAANSELAQFASRLALGLAVGTPQFLLDAVEEAQAAEVCET